jgi:hypothetical protein
MISNAKLFVILLCTVLVLAGWGKTCFGQTIMTLNPSNTYQTITGWEATAYAADWPGHGLENYPAKITEVLQGAVNDLGITRLRVEIWAGHENPIDYWTQFVNGTINETQYVHTPGYSKIKINDNADPNSINSSGFQFSFLDHQVDTFVTPMKSLIEANGESIYINVCYVDFGTSAFEHSADTAEYAEFVLATYQHLDSKYGWVPDSWEVALEPDNTSDWTGTVMGNAIVDAAARLTAAGYTPNFVAPSTTSMSTADNYFDSIIGVSGASSYLSEISYHRYSGVSDAALQAIATRAVNNNMNAAMIEHMGSSYSNLHKDLEIGRNSSWSGGYSLAGSNASYDLYNEDGGTPPNISITNHAKFYRMYQEFVRPGAVRIDATSNNGSFDPLGFINTDGKYVVVVKASSGGSFSIKGLPAAMYGIKYTTSAQYDVDLVDVNLGAGQNLNANIPAAGVLTVYAKSNVPPSPPTGLRILDIK